MTSEATSAADVYYDPYDFEIDADPYPIFKRMRAEAPLYYNERHDFYALSRFDDVARFESGSTPGCGSRPVTRLPGTKSARWACSTAKASPRTSTGGPSTPPTI